MIPVTRPSDVRRAMTERELQYAVLELARVFRWRTYHTHDSRRSAAGFPDLVLVRPPRLLFVELKSEGGRVTADQAEWLDDLMGVPGVEACIWRPADLDTIERVLR